MSELEDEYVEAPENAPTAEQRLNIGEVALHALGRFPMTIVLCTVIGLAGAVVSAFSQPNSYSSTGMILVRLGAREQRTPEGAMREEFQARSSPVGVWDELLMFRDPNLQRRVAEQVGAARIMRTYDPKALDTPTTPAHIRWIHSLQARIMGNSSSALEDPVGPASTGLVAAAIDRLAEGVRVNVQSGTSTIEVSFSADDPVLAQLVVRAYLDVFRQRHREIYATSDELSFISTQLATAESEVEEAVLALREWGNQDGIQDLESLIGDVADEIRGMVSLNMQDEILVKTLVRQLEILDTQLEPYVRENQAPTDAPSPQNLLLSYRYTSLISQVENAHSELAALANTYAAGSSILKDESLKIEQSIVRIQEELAEIEAEQEAPILAPREPNPVLAVLITEQLATARQKQSLEAGLAARGRAVGEYQERLAEMMAMQPAHTQLQQDLTDARDRAAQLTRAKRQTQILELIDADERMSNLIVTQEPTLPTAKDGPERTQALLVGLFGGLALGCTLAFMRQVLDPRLRYPQAVESALGIRVIGVVPEERAWRRSGRRLQQSLAKEARA